MEADMRQGRWIRDAERLHAKPSPDEKAEIGRACERFIEEVLKPHFLAEIRPTEWSYPVDIFGSWHGRSYRFIQTFRNGCSDRCAESRFDRPFARIEYEGPDRFTLSYMRHTGAWSTIHCGLSLREGLETMEALPVLHPVS
jgi:hypothetical protein